MGLKTFTYRSHSELESIFRYKWCLYGLIFITTTRFEFDFRNFILEKMSSKTFPVSHQDYFWKLSEYWNCMCSILLVSFLKNEHPYLKNKMMATEVPFLSSIVYTIYIQLSILRYYEDFKITIFQAKRKTQKKHFQLVKD